MEKIIADYINIHSRKNPDKIALVVDGKELSYAELSSRINRVAYYINSKYNLGNQNRVILLAEKSANFVILYFALHRLNLIVLPLDTNISNLTLGYIQKDVSPSLLIGSKAPDYYKGEFHYFDEFTALNNEYKEFDIFINSSSLDDIADIMYTSGTTGDAKGVMLSHRNLLTSATNIAEYIGNKADDVEVLALPICHSFGLGRLRSVLLVGGTMVFYNGFSNVKGLFHTIQYYKATGFSMVPASWEVLKKLSGTKISLFSSQLRYLEFGSANLPVEEKKQLLELLPKTRLCMHYGLTEASRSMFIEFHNDRLESIGHPVSRVSVNIVDQFNNVLDEGNIGEICIKGDHVTIGYWNNMSLTKQAFIDGYFRTGDIGYKKDGYFYLTGRIKDIINVGGKKVSALEIEEIARKYPGVSECACIGITDDVMGEQIKLIIVKSSGVFDLSSLKKYLKSNLEKFKLPYYYEFMDSLPKTNNGKIKKFLLK